MNAKFIDKVEDGVFSGMLRATLTKIGSVTITDAELLAIKDRPAEIIGTDVSVPGQITLSLLPAGAVKPLEVQ